MSTRYVRVQELKLGTVIAEDIFANTQFPIIHKNTKVSHEHLHIFKAFNIKNVFIHFDENVKNGLNNIDENLEIPPFINISPLSTFNSFEKLYSDAVSMYKKEFSNWSAGAKVDIAKIRTLILPLVEKVLDDRSFIFDLNTYSNPKDYLYHHCIATGLIAGVIAQKLGLKRGNCIQMKMRKRYLMSSLKEQVPDILIFICCTV